MSYQSIDIDAKFLAEFKKEFGRLPTLMDLFMLREAEASVALSKDDSVQTMTFVEGRRVDD